MTSVHWRQRWFFSAPAIAILIGHFCVDIFSSMVPPLIGVVEREFQMSSAMAAWLLVMGSVCSGLAQPLFAWISDRSGTRIYGPLGVLLASIFIGLIGFSGTAFNVFLIYAIGMMGIGMFHPIATAKIGAIAGEQRGFAISLFFVFGMAGFFSGSLLGPFLVTLGSTIKMLGYLVVPGLVIAVLLHLNINKQSTTAATQEVPIMPLSSYDWWSIVPLYFSAVLRFMVNLAIIYLIVRWVETDVASLNPELGEKEVSLISTPSVGKAHAIMFVGQGLSGLLAGALIKQGKESWPLILTPILFAPCLMSLAFLKPGAVSFAVCTFVGIGYAAMTPITISVGQQLMPGHTRLASGLLLGGAWAVGSVGSGLAELGIANFGLPNTILTTGIVLMFAGILALGVKCPQGSSVAG